MSLAQTLENQLFHDVILEETDIQLFLLTLMNTCDINESLNSMNWTQKHLLELFHNPRFNRYIQAVMAYVGNTNSFLMQKAKRKAIEKATDIVGTSDDTENKVLIALLKNQDTIISNINVNLKDANAPAARRTLSQIIEE